MGNEAALAQAIGMGAAVLTTVAFVPQVLKTLRTRSAGDLSLTMLVVFSTGLALWFCYGLMIDSWPVMLANAVTLILNLVLLALKLRSRP